MAIQTNVTGKFDDNFVQVEVSRKRHPTRYYKVPENQADSFQKEYVKKIRRNFIVSLLTIFLTMDLTEISIVNPLTKKIPNKLIKELLDLLILCGTGLGAEFLVSSIQVKKFPEFLKKYNATEIHKNYMQMPTA